MSKRHKCYLYLDKHYVPFIYLFNLLFKVDKSGYREIYHLSYFNEDVAVLSSKSEVPYFQVLFWGVNKTRVFQIPEIASKQTLYY